MAKEKDLNYYREQMSTLKCCVIIPTYNNEQTLAQVISDALAWTPDVIVVNDGSTDSTPAILERFPAITRLSYSPNKGKGNALRTGLRHAMEKGFRYAITIDSDGQHFADDIPVFLDKIIEVPDSLLVGSRNLRQENMPKKNTFGNKFSNFWFYLFTGVNLPDTQSGYRLYPVSRMKSMRFISTKYEFEIEVMVKAAWRNIRVLPVPIKVFYAEGDKRVTHFRPGRDFTRISLLNTYLFFPALLWYKPIRLLRSLHPRNLKMLVHKHLLDPAESAARKSSAVAFGVFMGIIPIWGFQFVSALVLAHFFRLNKAIVGLAAQISVPPMIPFLLYASLRTGQWLLGKDMSETISTDHLTLETTKQLLHEYLFSGKVLEHLYEYLLGSVVFATAMAIASWLLTFVLLKSVGRKIPQQLQTEKTTVRK